MFRKKFKHLQQECTLDKLQNVWVHPSPRQYQDRTYPTHWAGPRQDRMYPPPPLPYPHMDRQTLVKSLPSLVPRTWLVEMFYRGGGLNAITNAMDLYDSTSLWHCDKTGLE